jgi:hypothetical protein
LKLKELDIPFVKLSRSKFHKKFPAVLNCHLLTHERRDDIPIHVFLFYSSKYFRLQPSRGKAVGLNGGTTQNVGLNCGTTQNVGLNCGTTQNVGLNGGTTQNVGLNGGTTQNV